MARYYVISSSEGVVLSYKPLIVSEAVLVDRNSVLLAGPREALNKVGDELGAKQLYFEGVVLPGFVDSHLHIDSLGFELESASLVSVRDRSELLKSLSDMAPNVGDWIVCGRFDHLTFPDRGPPTRREIDRAVPSHPVLLIHRSGHMGVLNTAGLKRAKDWIGGELVDYENGWIYESSLWKVRENIFREIDLKSKSKLLLRASSYLRESGVTAAGVAGCSLDCLRALENIDEDLRVRLYLYLYVDAVAELEVALSEIARVNASARRIRVNGFKVILDGALGPRTACLSSDYSDQPGARGVLLYSREQLASIARRANSYGLQVAVHAIGDAALDVVLGVYGELARETIALGNRVEHASLVRDDQLELIKVVKPIVVVQPHFAITDSWALDRIGRERVGWLYRYKSLHESTTVAFSTDAPVEPVDPWRTVYAALTRGEESGCEHGRLTRAERMELLEALDAYTRGSARALRDFRLGCLHPGCYSDMIVASENPLKAKDPRELLEIECRAVDLD